MGFLFALFERYFIGRLCIAALSKRVVFVEREVHDVLFECIDVAQDIVYLFAFNFLIQNFKLVFTKIRALLIVEGNLDIALQLLILGIIEYIQIIIGERKCVDFVGH